MVVYLTQSYLKSFFGFKIVLFLSQSSMFAQNHFQVPICLSQTIICLVKKQYFLVRTNIKGCSFVLFLQNLLPIQWILKKIQIFAQLFIWKVFTRESHSTNVMNVVSVFAHLLGLEVSTFVTVKTKTEISIKKFENNKRFSMWLSRLAKLSSNQEMSRLEDQVKSSWQVFTMLWLSWVLIPRAS